MNLSIRNLSDNYNVLQAALAAAERIFEVLDEKPDVRDPEKAAFYYERAASLEDFEAEAKVRHAQLLVGQSRYQEALPLLRRAQNLNPRDSVQEYLDQVERLAQVR